MDNDQAKTGPNGGQATDGQERPIKVEQWTDREYVRGNDGSKEYRDDKKD